MPADESANLIDLFSDPENFEGWAPWEIGEYARRLLELVPAEQLPERTRRLAEGAAKVAPKE